MKLKRYVILFLFIPLLFQCRKEDTEEEFIMDCQPDTMKISMNKKHEVCFYFIPLRLFCETDDSVKFKWSTGDTADHIFISQPGIYSVDYFSKPDGSYIKSDSIVIEMKELDLYIPTVFDPNENNPPTFFFPAGLFICKLQMKIFDLYGNKIYETIAQEVDSESNALFGWNGKNKKGKIYPSGSYIYFIKCLFQSGEEKIYTGTIDLY